MRNEQEKTPRAEVSPVPLETSPFSVKILAGGDPWKLRKPELNKRAWQKGRRRSRGIL